MTLATRLRGYRRHISGFRAMACTLAVLAVAACSDGSKSEKKEAKEVRQPGIATIAPAVAKAAGITIATAGPADMRETITLYGTVKPNAEREQSLRARYPGTVRLVAKRVGDSVSRGQTVLTVESSESLQTYPIVAPISGIVLERNANPGETVNSDTVLMRVADLSSVWVELAVFARDLGHVRAGMPVRILASDGDFTADATITYVSPSGDNGSQSVVARAGVDNSDHRWVPGQFVSGEVAVDEFRAPVTVVPSALQAMNGKDVVFVQTQRGFAPRAVVLGRRSRVAVEILRGLSPGERYAAANSYLIKAELTKGEAEED
ncbi:MAG: efflux RND transporter periplasmic adaptor subunit [Alphaproteobacteria bacterium]|jgi:cobalt-zinc-cadmium efflux system membrane fusion protein|nr:efflux RND transporter periplasmic adaptor subunit [Alphaproteobacteria bacterium]